MKTIRLPKDDVYNLIKSHKEGISVFEIEEQLTGKSQQEMIEESNNGIAEYDNRVDELRLEGKIFVDGDTHLWFADIHLSPERQDELRKKDEDLMNNPHAQAIAQQLDNMTPGERKELLDELEAKGFCEGESNENNSVLEMNRISVESSNIESIGYDSNSKILEIEFNNYSIYRYYEVAEDVYDELMAAESKGSYLYQKIKGVYRYERCD